MNAEYNLQFIKLCDRLNLGTLTNRPEQVFGGHLHRMYSVETSTGKYAVKALNPQVMLRPSAKKNVINSELIARIAAKYIHAAPAKIFEDTCMPEIDGQYYLVFDWIEGRSIFDSEITMSQCEKLGYILGQLHRIDFTSLGLTDDYYYDEMLVDWNFYLQKGKEERAEWSELFSENIDNLYNWNNRLIEAAKKLAQDTVINHGDLEPKNVIWQGDEPVIIDWEAAGFINPMHDLIENAFYWSDENGKINKDKFIAFVLGYRNIAKTINGDWAVILDKGFGAKLGWLEYSLKRSLGIECADEAEKAMGTDHVFGTIRQLHDYNDIKDNVINWMVELNA